MAPRACAASPTEPWAATCCACKPQLPVTFWDERLSTAAVTRVLIEEHDVNRKRRAEVVDKMAAGWILQGRAGAACAGYAEG
jgi:RNase H-fold protein (predicted Holliday junction resolvase)